MASRYVLTLYGACCALEMFAQARSIEQVAIGTDSFVIAQASATESVPFKVIETKDQYEMRNYGSGIFHATVHCHCSLAPENECPSSRGPPSMMMLHAGDFATTEEFQSHFTVSYTKGLSYLSAYFLGRNKDNVRWVSRHMSMLKATSWSLRCYQYHFVSHSGAYNTCSWMTILHAVQDGEHCSLRSS